METQWIVVANASLARFFQRPCSAEPLAELPAMAHPESRLKGSELADDRPGHEATDHSRGGNRYEPRSDPRRKEHARFARQIAEHLDAALARGSFGSLWLCASSPFLGELRAELSEAVAARVQLTEDSDYTALGLGELDQRLRGLHATS